jgi:hypothetical protein
MNAEDKVLARVKKMMAIAECSGATEHERDNALKMVYKTLAAHNLSMIDVSQHDQQKADPRDMRIEVGYSMPWAKSIYNSIACLFFCKYFSGAKVNAWKSKVHFVGRESNATTAVYMSQFIIDSLIKESRKMYGQDSSPEARAFALGAAHKISERCAALRKQSETDAAQATPGNALVMVDFYKQEKEANAMVIVDNGYTLKPSKAGKSTVNASAYDAGQAFGKNISLSVQIKGGTATQMKTLK